MYHIFYALSTLFATITIKVGDQWFWRVEFTVSNVTLISILAFSRQQLDRMRNLLIQAGRIVYKKGKGNQSGSYRMIPFDLELVSHNVTQIDTQVVTQPDTQVWHKCCTLIDSNNTSTSNILFDHRGEVTPAGAREGNESEATFLAELNIIYRNLTDDQKQKAVILADRLFKRYAGRKATEEDIMQVFHRVRETSRSSDGELLVCVSESKIELTEYAFKQAAAAGAVNWNYISGIYKNFFYRGIQTLEDAEFYDSDDRS